MRKKAKSTLYYTSTGSLRESGTLLQTHQVTGAKTRLSRPMPPPPETRAEAVQTLTSRSGARHKRRGIIKPNIRAAPVSTSTNASMIVTRDLKSQLADELIEYNHHIYPAVPPSISREEHRRNSLILRHYITDFHNAVTVPSPDRAPAGF